MRRRALLLAAALAPLAAAAQLDLDAGRPGVSPGGRPGVDEALRRTVTLVLRAEARRGELPAFITDPQPLDPEQEIALVPGGRLDPDFPAQAVPARLNRRLPHARGGSVWAAAGRWLIEVDPVRLRVLSVAPDVLPPPL
jgi:hypothetical protein